MAAPQLLPWRSEMDSSKTKMASSQWLSWHSESKSSSQMAAPQLLPWRSEMDSSSCNGLLEDLARRSPGSAPSGSHGGWQIGCDVGRLHTPMKCLGESGFLGPGRSDWQRKQLLGDRDCAPAANGDGCYDWCSLTQPDG